METIKSCIDNPPNKQACFTYLFSIWTQHSQTHLNSRNPCWTVLKCTFSCLFKAWFDFSTYLPLVGRILKFLAHFLKSDYFLHYENTHTQKQKLLQSRLLEPRTQALSFYVFAFMLTLYEGLRQTQYIYIFVSFKRLQIAGSSQTG